MTDRAAPEVDCRKQHATLTVSDIDAAVDFYTSKLGFRRAFTWGDPPQFAGVNLGDDYETHASYRFVERS